MMRTVDGKGGSASGQGSQSSFPEQGDWFVLNTLSRQEKAIARRLIDRGLGCFLPLVQRDRTYVGRQYQVEVPLFPRYVFMRGELNAAREMTQNPRIARVIPVPVQAQLDEQLRSLNRIQTSGAHLDPCPFLARSMLVKVRSGPLCELQGLVDGSIKEDRLVVQIDVVEQAASVRISADLLEPIASG
jgi:transcription antitermination factor NusG